MFVGHFAVALAAKRVEPRLSLAWLFVAVQLSDILWPLFILLGVEHARIVPGLLAASPLDLYDYPWSHSLLMSVVWSALLALPWLATRRWRAAAVMAVAVFSHFILDVVCHRPDVPLAPGAGPKLGLGLWHSVPGTLVVEGGLWVAALAFYAAGSPPRRRIGSVGFWITMALLTLVWLGGMFAPPPPDIRTVAVSILVTTALLVPWMVAVDRARPVAPVKRALAAG
jgi:membrane-bound metal-dependent hydrolase YbcI (DUF457 family)